MVCDERYGVILIDKVLVRGVVGGRGGRGVGGGEGA